MVSKPVKVSEGAAGDGIWHVEAVGVACGVCWTAAIGGEGHGCVGSCCWLEIHQSKTERHWPTKG